MRDTVERIRLQSGKIHSAASFQSIYYWQDVQKLDICLTDSAYLVRCRDRGVHDYYMPVGDADEIRALLTALAAEGAFRLHYAGVLSEHGTV